MAVEARHLNLFPSQQLYCNNINNSDVMNPVQGLYGGQIGYGVPMMSGGLVSTEALLPAYNNSVMNDAMLPKTTAMQSDSGLTYNVPISTAPLPRKRARVDPINPSMFSYPTHYKTNTTTANNNSSSSNSFSFLGEDISLQIQQQQLDIDRLISQHMEKVRLEIEEKRRRQARWIMESIELGVMKRLRAKEAEIEKIGKMNWALEEKVKSLCIENQIWRDLAQTNEATANALRTNLEQVLAQEPNQNNPQNDAVAAVDDAESCCGSSGEEEEESGGGMSRRRRSSRWCRNCGKEESCVLLLPCRHLCLCTVCGSSLHTCPVCKSTKNASVHVNMS